MPLILLVVSILLFNLATANSARHTAPAAGTAVSAQQPPAAPATPVPRPPILQATILPSPTPTITPFPTVANFATITLYGPPAEASVLQNGRFTVYWTYSEALLPGQQFVLLLQQNEQLLPVGTVAGPNFGEGYQLLINLDGSGILPGTAVWQLQLEWANQPGSLLASEERILVVLPE